MNSIGLHKTEVLDPKILDVFELSKLLKSEYIMIPRNIFQRTPNTSILGLSYDCIVTIANFNALHHEKYYSLWEETSLPWIAFEGKSVNQFSQDHKAVFTNQGIKDIPKIEHLKLYYNSYMVNNHLVSIGDALEDIIADQTNLPFVKLFSHDHILMKIESMLFAFQNSSFVVQNVDITEQEDFMNIINSKAGVGATMWVPEIGILSKQEAHRYIMSLKGTLLNVSKGDKVICTIKDRLAGRTGYNFIVRFDVYKPKKACTLSYYMMMLKVV